MAKKRKWTIVPLIAAASLILVILYLLTLRKPPAPAEPLKAIPVSASLIIRVNDFKALFDKTTTGNNIWNELRSVPWFEGVNRQVQFLDSLFRNVNDAEQLLLRLPSFISVHVTGKDRLSVMHVLQLPARYNEKRFTGFITGLAGSTRTIKERNYEGITIHEIAFQQGSLQKNLYFAVAGDILILSFSTLLVEDAIRQLSLDESVINSGKFPEAYAIAGKNVPANIFINFSHFSRSLSALVTPGLKSEMRSVQSFAGWAELDINMLSDRLLMNGFVIPPDSVTSVASILLNQLPQRLTADEVLPGSTASFFTLSLSDPVRYLSDYQAYLQDQGLLSGYQNSLENLNRNCNASLPGDMIEIMDNEISLAFDPGNQQGKHGHVYVLIRVKSVTQAEDWLRSLQAGMAASESRTAEQYTSEYRFDNELTFSIHRLPVSRFTAKIFGSIFSALDEHYGAVIGNYLVFSSSVEAVQYLIHSYVLKKTLRNDPAFRTFTASLSPRSCLLYYCNLGKAHPVYAPFLKGTFSQSWENSGQALRKVQNLGFQLYTENNMIHGNVMLQYISSYSGAPQTVWESRLDTLADFKPVFALNHQTRQNEVFVQDLNNNIYLVNQVGRILWKIRLPEPINSEVFQVDYFRNGKLQLLFSTRHELYLIDRNGNFVDRYPVKLRSPATCGVSVFDYDGNRDYRLFIACEDRHVYAYNKEGSLLPGWDFSTTEHVVTQPVQHFRIGDRDFIVFGDRYNTYILDRKGNTRVEAETFFPRSARNTYLIDMPRDGSGPSLVTTDTTGKVYFIGLNGQSRSLRPERKYTDDHFFDYRDLNGDGNPELIYLEENTLTVYTSKMTRMFSVDFDSSPLSRPVCYQFSATDRKIGVVCRAENRIYLINNTGEPYTGFPLQGNTPFSIGNFGDTLSRFNLVVGSSDNFLYNYRVE